MARGGGFHPEAAALEPGDLLWARGVASWGVPRGRAGTDPTQLVDDFSCYAPQSLAEWEEERAGFARAGFASPAAPDIAEQLAGLTFEQFARACLGAAAAPPPRTRALSSVSRVSTGHVAIVARNDRGEPVVVEARRHKTDASRPYALQRCKAFGEPPTYAQWLAAFTRPVGVWHGRLRNIAPASPDTVAAAALEIVRANPDADFSLFNFRLDDTSAFYCGKLVWLAVYRASGGIVGVDGDPDPDRDPRRLGWCSPADIMQCARHVALLFPPGTSVEAYVGALGGWRKRG